ncbi:glycosyltransferase family 2 protein [Cyclonatronum proteinivorum]|uniref:glycosyltransferase family 2 protein n=1 Tax=Cyclonatronum proteinivorum TaxID=1457365 RepID=UPI0013DFC030|nr:glycosyltransferase family 2 protein [Cyclonatronum proteinivorum]
MPDSRVPQVTVITAVFNAEAFVAQTVQSVLDQAFGDFEYLIVDDASTDSTPDIIQGFAENDNRIHVFRNTRNLGVAASRNRALAQAKGKYIAFLDGDDIWYPDFLREMLLFMEDGGFAFGCASHKRVDEKLIPLRKPFIVPEAITRKELLRTCSVPLLTTMLRRDAFDEIRFPLLPVNNDYGLWLKLIRSCGTIYGNPKVLAVYRMRKGSVSSDKLRSMRYIWQLYRTQEKLGFLTACRLMFIYTLNGFRKYYGS